MRDSPGLLNSRVSFFFLSFTGRTSTSNTRRENGDPPTAWGCAHLRVIIQKQNTFVCLGLCSGLAAAIAIMELSLEFNTHKKIQKSEAKKPED